MSIVRHVVIRGLVQAVGFRAFVQDAAEERYLEGWVRNRSDGSVEAVLSGREDAVDTVIKSLRAGPPAAKVEAVDVKEAASDLLQQRPKNTRFAVLPTG
ncbi:MAG: acylphosphatase [Alphaproteobacteria bacterium]